MARPQINDTDIVISAETLHSLERQINGLVKQLAKIKGKRVDVIYCDILEYDHEVDKRPEMFRRV